MRRISITIGLLLWAASIYAGEPVAGGEWTRIDYDVAGRWQITEENGHLHVALDENFETRDGPDLHVLLTARPLAQLTDGNAADGALVVGKLVSRDRSRFLRKMRGAQQFVLPEGTRLSDYRSIIIHCVEFSHLWAGAALAPER